MAKIICIGDVHNKWVQAQTIIDRYIDTHKIVMVGDYWDDFYDTAIDADQTARWVKKCLEHSNIVMLLGNHDINYAYYNLRPGSNLGDQIYNCSGYTSQKDDAINRILTNEDWDKIKIAHYDNGFWFTHAGVHPIWFGDFNGMTNETIQKKLDDIKIAIETRSYCGELGGAGRCRGGSHRIGGLLWRDHRQEPYTGGYWNDNSGIKQVYGHTPVMNGIDIEETANGGVCIDIDCGLSQVLEINEDGAYNIISTDLKSFYVANEEARLEKMRKKVFGDIGAYDHIYKNL